jgi:hypothetical protein
MSETEATLKNGGAWSSNGGMLEQIMGAPASRSPVHRGEQLSCQKIRYGTAATCTTIDPLDAYHESATWIK